MFLTPRKRWKRLGPSKPLARCVTTCSRSTRNTQNPGPHPSPSLSRCAGSRVTGEERRLKMKESDVLVLEEPKLSLGDQFYVPQVLKGLGTTMKHMLQVLGGTDRV